MKEIIVVLVLVVIGLALSPVIGVFSSQAAGNASGAAATMYNLVPLFWAILVVVIGAAAIWKIAS